ncbi:hypothetical protein [Oricola cellulosilytica]|uniref:hypothetical protein n=1 Tax=Oricola cellulosilytica TaxID=1429082 RepID=UPI001304A3A3|nr:hypothetical protein [Oricola cellulosilytica]
MRTIRKFAASRYDFHALTAQEQDALMDEARAAAAAERSAAIGALFGAMARAVSALFATLAGRARRRKLFLPRHAGDREAIRQARQGGLETCRRRGSCKAAGGHRHSADGRRRRLPVGQ